MGQCPEDQNQLEPWADRDKQGKLNQENVIYCKTINLDLVSAKFILHPHSFISRGDGPKNQKS